jgi:tRNA pseudouridine32 synthase/23S rRNA pseudouridine746 synthase/23S rRNA pseudouridine955/2504/2580 synthase
VSFTLLAERPGFVAIDKPAGLAVIPGRDGDPDCVRTRLGEQLKRPIWVVHRLDRDTSGVLLFALDAATHRKLSMAFEGGELGKRYLALVEGRLEAEKLIDKPLAEARKSRMRIAREGEAGKAAQTRVRPLTLFAKATLVEAEPLTGRTHQIRVHLLSEGHPLLFDHQYGRKTPLTARDLGGSTEEVVLARTPLHASRLIVDGEAIEAPVPADFAAALAVLGHSK